MPYDPTNPTSVRPMVQALGQQRFGGPGGMLGGMGQRYGSMLTDAGYGGPMPGTPEFQAARASGATPIKDWARENMPALREQFQNAGGFGGMMGAGGPRPMNPPMGQSGFGQAGGMGANAPAGATPPRPMGAPQQMPRPPMTMGGAPAGFGLPPSPTAPRPMNTGIVPPSMQPQYKR